MINWLHISEPDERQRMANELDATLAALVAAQRLEMDATQKLARKRTPAAIAKGEAVLAAARAEVTKAQSSHEANVRRMCDEHLDFNLDDVVEVHKKGVLKRQAILVQDIEFCRSRGRFWLRVKGLLMDEGDGDRPPLTQSFDLKEDDPDTVVVKLN